MNWKYYENITLLVRNGIHNKAFATRISWIIRNNLYPIVLHLSYLSIVNVYANYARIQSQPIFITTVFKDIYIQNTQILRIPINMYFCKTKPNKIFILYSGLEWNFFK